MMVRLDYSFDRKVIATYDDKRKLFIKRVCVCLGVALLLLPTLSSGAYNLQQCVNEVLRLGNSLAEIGKQAGYRGSYNAIVPYSGYNMDYNICINSLNKIRQAEPAWRQQIAQFRNQQSFLQQCIRDVNQLSGILENLGRQAGHTGSYDPIRPYQGYNTNYQACINSLSKIRQYESGWRQRMTQNRTQAQLQQCIGEVNLLANELETLGRQAGHTGSYDPIRPYQGYNTNYQACINSLNKIRQYESSWRQQMTQNKTQAQLQQCIREVNLLSNGLETIGRQAGFSGSYDPIRPYQGYNNNYQACINSFDKIKRQEQAWRQQINQFTANRPKPITPIHPDRFFISQPGTRCTLNDFRVADTSSFRISANEEILSLQIFSSCNEYVVLTIEVQQVGGKKNYNLNILPNYIGYLDINVPPGFTSSQIVGFRSIPSKQLPCDPKQYSIERTKESWKSPRVVFSVKSKCINPATVVIRFDLQGNDSRPDVRYIDVNVPPNSETKTEIIKSGYRGALHAVVDIR